MAYSSTRELAERWGVSPSRVVYLAKNGRIPGARLVGKSWLFPSDAEKPVDRRTRSGKILTRKKDFKFPLYYFNNYSADTIANDFSQDETRLYEAEACYLKSDYEGCFHRACGLVYETTDDIVKVGCLYHLCLCCIYLGKYPEFITFLGKYKSLLTQDLPHKRELELTYYDLETYFYGNAYYLEEFKVDSDYSYHPSASCYLALMACYSAMLKCVTCDRSIDLNIHVLLCRSMERNASPLTLTYMHAYIAGMAIGLGEKELFNSHVEKCLSLALEHGYLHLISYAYKYFPTIFDELVSRPGYEQVGPIVALCKRFYTKINGLMDFMGNDPLLTTLSPKDFPILYWAHKGFTNKEIAQATNLSLSTVSKRFSVLYARTDTANRKELLERTKKSFSEY